MQLGAFGNAEEAAKLRDRARRIVAGEDGDRYYTDDHYDSFRQIEEGT